MNNIMLSIDTKLKLMTLKSYFIVFSAMIVTALMFHKYFESVVLFVTFCCLRYKFDKTYHCPNYYGCIAMSILLLCSAIIFTPYRNISIYGSIVMGFLICSFAYKLQDYKELKDIKIKKPTTFNADTCTESELLARCKELRFSEHNTQLCVELFIKKTKHKVLADKLCIDEFSVTTQKYRLKQKLNKE